MKVSYLVTMETITTWKPDTIRILYTGIETKADRLISENCECKNVFLPIKKGDEPL